MNKRAAAATDILIDLHVGPYPVQLARLRERLPPSMRVAGFFYTGRHVVPGFSLYRGPAYTYNMDQLFPGCRLFILWGPDALKFVSAYRGTQSCHLLDQDRGKIPCIAPGWIRSPTTFVDDSE